MDSIFLMVTVLASIAMAVGLSAAGLQILINFISPRAAATENLTAGNE